MVVFLAPPFTPWQFAPYPLLRWGDVLDLATPLVMLPMYWLLLSHGRRRLGAWEMAAFLVLGAIWIEGQSIHLAANAIGHLVERDAAGDLTEFLDERLGHYMWHGAAVALAGLVALRGLDPGTPRVAGGGRALGLVAAAIYGLAMFLISVEGGTAVLALAGGAVVTGIAARRGLQVMLSHPKSTLFGVGYPAMALLLGIWFVYWGGRLPEFSSIGLIK